MEERASGTISQGDYERDKVKTMEHTPSVPLNVDMGWHDNKRKVKRCTNCGQKLPQDEQNGFIYRENRYENLWRFWKNKSKRIIT